MTEDKISNTHPDYNASSAARKVWNDVMGGTLKVRNKEYLPQFPAELDASHKFRIQTSTLFNMSEKTRNVMVGLAFQEPIELEADVLTEIKTLWENIDNQGNHGDVFWREVFESSFAGWSVQLTDAPAAKARSLEEERSLQLRPYAINYHADCVINWRHRINPISKAKELEMIVFKEVTNELKPGSRFMAEQKIRYRAFFLVGAKVTWELWEERKDTDTSESKPVLIDSGAMERVTQIPVSVVGTLGAQPPLIDIAIKNIEHFQTYSDYKSLIHKTCVPLLLAKDLVKPTEGSLVISGDKLTEVSKDGDLRYTEVSGSSLNVIRQSLIDNREEIALMGLSLLADKTAKVDVTATEALLDNIGETAELRVLARSCQDAIELSFGHMAEYLGKKREQGGSIVMGTAWSKAEQKAEIEEERADQRFEKEMKTPVASASIN